MPKNGKFGVVIRIFIICITVCFCFVPPKISGLRSEGKNSKFSSLCFLWAAFFRFVKRFLKLFTMRKECLGLSFLWAAFFRLVKRFLKPYTIPSNAIFPYFRFAKRFLKLYTILSNAIFASFRFVKRFLNFCAKQKEYFRGPNPSLS